MISSLPSPHFRALALMAIFGTISLVPVTIRAGDLSTLVVMEPVSGKRLPDEDARQLKAF
jgi:hypothetical protein